MVTLKDVISSRLDSFVWDEPQPDRLIRRFMLANRRWRLPLRVSWEPETGHFLIEADGDMIIVARPPRLRYFRTGIVSREEQLIREYCLAKVPITEGDLVVDVGANIGEVSRLLARRNGAVPIAIEPDGREFTALQRNLLPFRGRALHELLWSSVEDLRFFDDNDSGDSSIFAARDGLESEVRRTTTLDALLDSAGYSDASFRLLKLEAEGAEPEILDGAAATLARTEFVAVDAGPERGLNKETTLVPVYERLRARGFKAIDVYAKRLVVLFQQDGFAAF